MERLGCVRTSVVLSVFAVLCFQSSGYDGSATGARKRFEYKLSFKGPHLVQRDGTIPFWEHIGHAIASEESVRITPSLKSKKGAVWARELNTYKDWEIEVVFRVNGRGRIGADGLAVWYTDLRAVEGPVFGSKDNWNGLGVFFDSFDNDNLRNNPWIMAMVNDGTKSYQHDTDGGSQQLGGCLRDFRNKPFPVRVKIEYFKKALTIHVNNGLTNNKDSYELCMRAEGVDLPASGYFGVSAATGDLADDHDVLAFLTHSLTPIQDTPPQNPNEVPDQERKKFEQEFQEYQQKLQKAKEEYKKEHPSKPGEINEEDDRMYDATDVRELRMIFDGQNAMHQLLRTMLVKLDEVIGRQERELSMLTMINQQQQSGLSQHPQTPPGHQQQQQQQQQLPHSSVIQRHEVDTMLTSHRELSNSVRDVRSLLNDLQTRVAGLAAAGGAAAGGAAGAQNSAEMTQTLRDMKTHLGYIQGDMKTLISRPPPATPNCPQVAEVNCVSSFTLVAFLIAQLFCIIGYMIYRSSKEAAAKKFY